MKTEALRAMANDLKYNTGLIHSNIKLLIEESFISGVKYGQSNPKTKQLEWWSYTGYYSADTHLVDYLITPEYGTDINVKYLLWINKSPISRYRTLDEAKAAAQADFEKRVREFLDL